MAIILGTGKYLPNTPLSNDYISKILGSGIIKMVGSTIGLKERYLSIDLEKNEITSGNLNSEMAAKAAQQALDDANLTVNDIDMIILTTSSPDYPSPPTVVYVQDLLGIDNIPCLELRSGCVGAIQAISIAYNYLNSGQYSTILVIGSELSSSYALPINKNSKSSLSGAMASYMSGDGAAALVLGNNKTNSNEIKGLCFSSMSKGKKEGFLIQTGGSKYPATKYFLDKIDQPVIQNFTSIINYGPLLVKQALIDLQNVAPYKKEEIKYVIPPQANIRIMDMVKIRFGSDYSFKKDQLYFNISKYGNTYSASLLLALNDLKKENKLLPGDKIILIGAEITKWIYGALLIEWSNKQK